MVPTQLSTILRMGPVFVQIQENVSPYAVGTLGSGVSGLTSVRPSLDRERGAAAGKGHEAGDNEQ
jgi:hypothetical protein